MFSGTFKYPFEAFRDDLRALPTILKQEKIHRLDGEVWDASAFDGGEFEVDLKIGSYFVQRYSDQSKVLELSGLLSMAIRQIADHLDTCAPGCDEAEVVDSGFAQIPEPILRAIHALHTEVDIVEWGDDRDETFEFVLEVARTRFGYGG